MKKESADPLAVFFENQYPCIEKKGTLYLLHRDQNVVTSIPSINDPLALTAFTRRFPPDFVFDLFVALHRPQWPNIEESDRRYLLDLLKQAKASPRS